MFQERKDCFFICCDVKEMMRINEISHRAGDLAIIEAMERMSAAAGEGDLVFRIGGDEFCILTDSREESYAEGIAEAIRARNGESFSGRAGRSRCTCIPRLSGWSRSMYAMTSCIRGCMRRFMRRSRQGGTEAFRCIPGSEGGI